MANKEKRYDPGVNLEEDEEYQNNHSPVNASCDGELTSKDLSYERIYNDLGFVKCSEARGPYTSKGTGTCKGGNLHPDYAANYPHITGQTQLWEADRTRWSCKKGHKDLCINCVNSPKCPVDGSDYYMYRGQLKEIPTEGSTAF